MHLHGVGLFDLPIPVLSKEIINLTSNDAFSGMTEYTVYVGTKAAIVAFRRVLALEMAPHDIRVNAIAPMKNHSTGAHQTRAANVPHAIRGYQMVSKLWSQQPYVPVTCLVSIPRILHFLACHSLPVSIQLLAVVSRSQYLAKMHASVWLWALACLVALGTYLAQRLPNPGN